MKNFVKIMSRYLSPQGVFKLLFFSSNILILTWNGCSNSVSVIEPRILQCPDKPLVFSGEATYYDITKNVGSCSFDSASGDTMIGAINQFDYAGSEMCGGCLRVNGPRGTVLIRIIDLCPECPKGNLDLSPQAFSVIADTTLGRVAITWQLVPCEVSDSISIHFNDSTNQWWTAVQVRNHRYPIYSLEYLTAQNKFKRVNRTEYNYFVETGGMNADTLIFRLTDIYGHIVTDTVKTPLPGHDVKGGVQFPLCKLDSGN